MIRIQRRRAKGYRLPPNTLCVSRPGPWGNPFIVGRDGTVADCVRLFRFMLAGLICLTCKTTFDEQIASKDFIREHIDELPAYDYIACWCRLGDPCHADTLIEVARSRAAEMLKMWRVGTAVS